MTFMRTEDPLRCEYVSTPSAATPMGRKMTYMDIRRALLTQGLYEVQFVESQLTPVVREDGLYYLEPVRIMRALHKWAKKEGFSLRSRFAKDTLRLHIELVQQERIRSVKRNYGKDKSA